MAKPGDWVILKTLPSWIDDVPKETQDLLRFCLVRRLKVEKVDQNGCLVLLVGKEADNRFGGTMNDIRIEEQYVVRATGSDGRRDT